MPRLRPQASSSTVATAERTPDWNTSDMPSAANFAATWPMPQIRHSSTISEMALASSGLRSSLIPSYYHSVTLEASLAEVLDWLFRTPPPAAVQRKAREQALDTFGCAIAGRRDAEVGAFAQSPAAEDPGSAASAAASFAAAPRWGEACQRLP